MSDLVLTLLRGGLLILMWLLIIAIVSSQAKDLQLRRLGPRVAKNKPAASAAPAPAAPATQSKPAPRYLQITAGIMEGQKIPLENAPIVIGRSEQADLVLADDYTSGQHARLFPQGSRWFLEDLGSTNGTYLNNQPLTRAMTVEPGQTIRIGKSMMELRV